MKILKWVGIGLLVIAGALAATVFALQNKKFDAPYPDIVASTDSAVIARGKYLAYGTAHCAHCHGKPGELGKMERGEDVELSGGFVFQLPIGKVHVPNITPDEETGIGKVSDKEIARSLRHGVGTDGRAILDFMPFYDISDEDLTAIISFLRSQKPVKNEVPKHEFNLLGKVVKAFALKPMGDGDAPARVTPDTTAEHGKYLAANVANCRGCHTERNLMTGDYIGEDYSGGFKTDVMNLDGVITKDKHLVSVNLTPDPETGRMTDWTKQQFITRFRQGRIIEGSIMPWGTFSRMTDDELTAIYYFLKTLKPVKKEAPLGVQDGSPM